MDKTQHVTGLSSLNTGGGCIVDCVHLADGRVLGVNDECVVLYKNMEDLYTGENRPMIDLLQKDTEPDDVVAHAKKYGWVPLRVMLSCKNDALQLNKFLQDRYQGCLPSITPGQTPDNRFDGTWSVSWCGNPEMAKDFEDWVEFGPFPCDSTDQR